MRKLWSVTYKMTGESVERTAQFYAPSKQLAVIGLQAYLSAAWRGKDWACVVIRVDAAPYQFDWKPEGK